jgi:LacI family transcriptional regulator
MRTTTIKDIAERAGVSIATVSYVINESRPVSPELTARVVEAIEELGYSPNEIARSLRQKRTNTIGLVVPDNSNPFFAELAKGVEDAGFGSEYSVILCNSNYMPERELAYLNVLQSKRVDGIIFIATTTQMELIKPLVNRNIPAVIFYRDIDGIDADVLRIDNYKVGHIATSYLIELGHREIACIRPPSDDTPTCERVVGFERALEESGLTRREDLMPRGDYRIGGGKEAAQQMLKSGYAFSAVFACNDAMAIGAMRALREAGLRIPEDVSIVGVDDIQLASFSEPPLTTVAQPKYEAGLRAVELLIDRIERRYNQGPRQIVLELKLVVRQSCARFQPAT